MAYTLGNKCAKNLCKRIVLLQLIVEYVVTCFFGTQCIVTMAVYVSVAVYEIKQEIGRKQWRSQKLCVGGRPERLPSPSHPFPPLPISICRMGFLHPAMWQDHNIDFVRWLHPAVWHVALE